MRTKSVLVISALSALLLTSGLSQAHYHGHQYTKDNNFLVGGTIGYARTKENFVTRFSSPVLVPTVLLADQEAMISDNGLLFGLLAGWQWHCNRILLGVEGNVDFAHYFQPRPFSWSDLENVTFPLSYSGTAFYDRGTVWALTGRAGYFVTPGFLPYVRLGAQVSEDEVNYQVFSRVPTPLGFVPDFSSKEETVWGVVAGIGAEFPTFIGGTTLRVEYTFSRSERIQIEDDLLPILGTHKFHYPEMNALRATFVYNFL